MSIVPLEQRKQSLEGNFTWEGGTLTSANPTSPFYVWEFGGQKSAETEFPNSQIYPKSLFP